jgi:hypothetical protein
MAMMVHGAAVVVAFQPVADVRLAMVWDGGQYATVHTVDDGQYGPVLERWEMTDPHTGHPRVACTPAALAELVRFRVEETPGAAELVAAAVDLAGVV